MKTISMTAGSRRPATPALHYLAALIGLVVAMPAPSQQKYAELDSSRIQQIAAMLPAQPSGFGKPCSDRTAWAAVEPQLKGVIPQAEKAMATPLPPFDPEAYLAFTKTGDREPMQKNLASRENRLAPLVLAECLEGKGRFIPAIDEVMDSLVAMPSWTLSAHDAQLLNFHGTRYSVDLNAADMGDALAETLYLLGDRIPSDTRAHVVAGIEKHVFGPMRASFLHGNSVEDRGGNWWLYADMNWNAVCVKGVTGAALAMLPSVEDRALFAAAAEHYILHYDKGFSNDGYDTEGLSYWNYGFSHFIELRENLLRATGGKIDLLADPKMQNVSMFGLQFPMLPNNSAAYGDAGRMPKADAHLVAVISHILGLSSGPLPPENAGSQPAALTSIALDLFPIQDDVMQSQTARELGKPQLCTYYADEGILVSRGAPGQNFAVTIKAGGNTTHSHNDIGSWVIGMGSTQPLGEPGGPAFYNAATFGPHRLDSKLLNSFGHPVPEIGGQLQLDATRVHVSVTDNQFSDAGDSITIDMTNAYSVPELKKVTRTLTHSRAGNGSVEVTDAFDLTRGTEIIESLPTHGTWTKVDDNTLLFSYEGAQVKVTIEASVAITITETKVDEYRNPFTRVEVHVPLAGSGKVTMRLVPVQ
jgi:hypothetical protein